VLCSGLEPFQFLHRDSCAWNKFFQGQLPLFAVALEFIPKNAEIDWHGVSL